jgi:hypothetical protein
VTTPPLTPADLARVEALLEKATPPPWRWTAGVGDGPQIEGAVEYPEMSPVLVAHGCGNKERSEAGVAGCIPGQLKDPLRACPLHPTAADRDIIVELFNAAPTLLAAARENRELRDALAVWEHDAALAAHASCPHGFVDRVGCAVCSGAYTALESERDALRERVAELENSVRLAIDEGDMDRDWGAVLRKALSPARASEAREGGA